MNKLAVVGIGNWGKNHLRTFVSLLGENCVIACDTDTGCLERAQAQYPQLETTTQIGDVLGNSSIDAVVIATPAVTHFDLAKKALEAGKHVLVEKPIALRVEEAEELIELADHQCRRLMVDHLLEYHPAVEEMKQCIDRGELGEIYYLYSQRLNLGVIRTEENALWSLGPHDLSVILYLLGKEPARVSAHGSAYLQKESGIHDVVFLNLGFPDGVIAHAHLSWLDPHKIRKITAVGNRKTVVFDDMAREKLKVFDKRVERTVGGFQLYVGEDNTVELESEEEPLKRMARHFLESIKDNTRPRSDGRDGLRVLRVLAAAQRSLEEGGKPVRLEA